MSLEKILHEQPFEPSKHDVIVKNIDKRLKRLNNPYTKVLHNAEYYKTDVNTRKQTYNTRYPLQAVSDADNFATHVNKHSKRIIYIEVKSSMSKNLNQKAKKQLIRAKQYFSRHPETKDYQFYGFILRTPTTDPKDYIIKRYN